MRKIVRTKEFNFFIDLIDCNDCSIFEISAICILDNTKSCITNHNFIISELLNRYIKTNDFESSIEINKSVGIKIYDKAIKAFNDAEWLNLLNKELYNDRDAGEWS